MAMPRYRYAIGQAPVRFPSPAPSTQGDDDDDDDKENTAVNAAPPPPNKATRTNRWSTASIIEDVPAPTKRDEKTRLRLQDDRRRTKSMYDGPNESKLLSPIPQSSRLSPSPSSSSMKASGSSKSQSKQQTNERTPLRAKDTTDMTQLQQRPASTSMSSSIRPSSLFWTDYDSGKKKVEVIPQSHLPKSKSSYGAMETSRTSTRAEESEEDPSDPYGYRFLAGPALLPSFHEQQQHKQKQKEVNSRTCGPNLEAVKRNRWVIVALAGLTIVIGGIWYCFL